MDCNKIKEVIPRYFNHTASEEEIKTVEEHLCICHDCRTALGELMDKITDSEQPVNNENQDQEMQIIPGNLSETPLGSEAEPTKLENLESKSEDIEYFPGKGLKDLKDPEKNTAQEETSQVKESLELESSIDQQPQEPIPEIKEPALDTNDEIKPVLEAEPAQIAPLGSEAEATVPDVSEESFKTPDAVESVQEDKLDKEEAKDQSGLEILPSEDTQEDSYAFLEATKEQFQEKILSKVSKDSKVVGLVEYLYLTIAVAVLGFLIYLVLKG